MFIDYTEIKDNIVQVNLIYINEYIRNIEILYHETLLNLTTYSPKGISWIELPNISLLNRFTIDTRNFIDIRDLKSYRIVQIDYIRTLKNIINHHIHKITTKLYKIELENNLYSYILVHTNCGQNYMDLLDIQITNL